MNFGLSVDVEKGTKYVVHYSTNDRVVIFGYNSFDRAKAFYEDIKKFNVQPKIVEVNGQLTVENIIFDYMTKFRGKI